MSNVFIFTDVLLKRKGNERYRSLRLRALWTTIFWIIKLYWIYWMSTTTSVSWTSICFICPGIVFILQFTVCRSGMSIFELVVKCLIVDTISRDRICQLSTFERNSHSLPVSRCVIPIHRVWCVHGGSRMRDRSCSLFWSPRVGSRLRIYPQLTQVFKARKHTLVTVILLFLNIF